MLDTTQNVALQKTSTCFNSQFNPYTVSQYLIQKIHIKISAMFQASQNITIM